MAWNPQQYLKFAAERLRPGFDLLAQIKDLPPGPIFELGCGTGVHARAIAARWPGRAMTAIDNSPAMLAEASREPSGIGWAEADIATWRAQTPAALIFSNATLQWLPGHAQLFPRLLAMLAPGGVLAVQMPRNFGEASHRAMRALALEPPWAATLAPLCAPDAPGLLRLDPVATPEFYYDLLAPRAKGGIDLWETEYSHQLEGEDAVLEWMRGTTLRPIVEALGDRSPAYLAAYAARLRALYPRRPDGKTLMSFRRLFVVARA